MSNHNLYNEDNYRNLYYQLSKKQEESQNLIFKNNDLEQKNKVI
jgi:hypothetical protein